MLTVPGYEGDLALGAGLRCAPDRMIFKKTRPERHAFCPSQLAGNDVLDARAGSELRARMSSEIQEPRGRPIKAEVRCRHEKPRAVIRIADWHGSGAATAPTRRRQEADGDSLQRPAETPGCESECGALRSAEEATALREARNHPAETAKPPLLPWCQTPEAVSVTFPHRPSQVWLEESVSRPWADIKLTCASVRE